MKLRVVAVALTLIAAACGDSTPEAKTPPPAPSGRPAPSASVAPSSSASAAVSVPTPPDVACAALDQARKAENEKLQAVAASQDPMSRVQGMSEEVVAAFGKCVKTKGGGAWGLGVRDLQTDQALHGVTAELVALHADPKGHVASVVLQGTDRTKGRAFQSHEADRVQIDTQMTFDFDGDGEGELVVIGHDQTKDGPRDPMAYIVQVKSGVAQIYPPSRGLPIFRVEDVDRDGRPDFVSYGPYRSRIPARCNGAPAQVVGPPLLIHSLADGTFSMTDTAAVAFAKQQCDKPGFSVARDDQKRVDDDQTFVNIACARLWGMTAAQAASAVARSCTAIRGDASCKESTLLSCVYPAEMTKWARATPPLTLK